MKPTHVGVLFLWASLPAVLGTPVASAHEPRSSPLAKVYSSCVNSNQIALTFDDGPYIYLRNISDQLTAAGAKGSFFMNGNNWDCIYDADRVSDVKYAYAAGHMIGDHTWAHGDLTTFSNEQIEDAMYRMEEAFSRILGIKPAFVRPPYGNYNDNVQQIAYARNQSLAMWDQDTGDADGNTVAQSEQVYSAAVSSGLSNMLVLNHETEATTAGQVLPYALKLLKAHGYELVTLAECLNVEPYAAIGVPQSGSWSCDGTPDPGDGCSGNCETGVPILYSSTTTSTSTSTSHTTGSTPTGRTLRPGKASSMCLTAASNSNNAAVEIETCSGSSSQSWTYTSTPGTITIFSGTKCLDVTSGSTANGNKMQIYTCYAGNTNQQWYVTSDNRVAWYNKGECLDLTNGVTSSGNVVQMWKCTDNDSNQVWNFV